MKRRFIALSIGAILALASLAVHFSSQDPDGLEAAAHSLGIAAEEENGHHEMPNIWKNIFMLSIAASLAGGASLALNKSHKKVAH